MKIVLVHNQSAGEGSPDREELLRTFRDGGFEPLYVAVGAEGWKKALQSDPKPDVLVVAGGDGTIRKVVRETHGWEVPLVVMPLGTANNLAGALGISSDPEQIMSILRDGRQIDLDIGSVEGLASERFFIEGLGLGFLAETMQAVHRIKKESRHPVQEEMRAALEMLRLLAAESEMVELDLELDGRDHSGAYILVEVMNIRSVGSNIVLAPDADPSDGAFDVVLISERDRSRAVDFVQRVIDGEAVRPEFAINRARDISMAWEGSMLHVDDRIWPPVGTCPSGSRLHIKLDSARASFLVQSS